MAKQQKPRTHGELRERREKMAALILAGKSLGFVAKKFKCSVYTVRNACAEADIKLPDRRFKEPKVKA